MLNDAVGYKNVYIVTGYTNPRSGINRLASLIENSLDRGPFVSDTLYLFRGRRTNRIKGLVWEGEGGLLLYKRLEQGSFQWPRAGSEVRGLTHKTYHLFHYLIPQTLLLSVNDDFESNMLL